MHEDLLKPVPESIDGLFRNKVRVVQAVRGYRVSEDALILTWFSRPKPVEMILDAGTGCGAIAFGLVAAEPSVTVVGLEIQGPLADRAGRGVGLNRMQSSVHIVRGDLRQAHCFFRPGCFDAIVSNPPYHEAGRGRLNLHTEKALARHQVMMPIADLFETSRILLKTSGRLCLIYPAKDMDRITKTAQATGFQQARVLWIQPYAGSDPCLVCVEARLLPSSCKSAGLVLYERPGQRTAAVEAILAGEQTCLDC